MRLAVVCLVLALASSVASAGSITYDLVAAKHNATGIELTGYVRLPDSLVGDTTVRIFDALEYRFYATGPSFTDSWTSANSIIASDLGMRFVAPVGASTLVPFPGGAGSWVIGRSHAAIYPTLAFENGGGSGARWEIQRSFPGPTETQEGWYLVKRTTAAPEPSMLSLLGAALGILAGRRRRNRSRSAK